MQRPPSQNDSSELARSGYTLIELIVAIVASSFLLVGLASSIFIATQTVNPSNRTQQILDASETIRTLTDELRYATSVLERSSTMIEFVTDDRTGDGAPDRIRYEWSGIEGDPLTKVLNDSAPQTVVPEVATFDLEYVVESDTESFDSPDIQSAEKLLDRYVGTGRLEAYRLSVDEWIGQYIPVAEFNVEPLPADTLHWSVTKVQIRARRTDSTAAGQAWVRLKEATANQTPASTILDEATLLESSLGTSFGWETVTFSGETELGPTQNISLTIEHKSNPNAADIEYDEIQDDWRLVTDDGGATWTHAPLDDAMRYRLYGTYTQPANTTESIVHQSLRAITATLQIGDDQTAVVTESNLWNQPELCSAYWSTKFGSDPTAIDENFDGTNDWRTRDGAPFDVTELIDGVWHASPVDDVKLDTAGSHDFDKTTIIEARMRNTSIGGQGAVCWINADWQGTVATQIYASLMLQSDGTQTLSVNWKESFSTTHEVARIEGLTDDFIDVRIAVDPTADIFAVWHGGEFIGAYDYVPFNVGSTAKAVSLVAWGSDAEFDQIRIKVME